MLRNGAPAETWTGLIASLLCSRTHRFLFALSLPSLPYSHSFSPLSFLSLPPLTQFIPSTIPATAIDSWPPTHPPPSGLMPWRRFIPRRASPSIGMPKAPSTYAARPPVSEDDARGSPASRRCWGESQRSSPWPSAAGVRCSPWPPGRRRRILLQPCLFLLELAHVFATTHPPKICYHVNFLLEPANHFATTVLVFVTTGVCGFLLHPSP